jgi:NAD(P)-dependent dehydrogenase (short-subunit alcohol dehydrogenase family)
MALVLGASGGIGSAICSQLLEDRSFSAVLTCSRSSGAPLDLCCESSIKLIATDVAQRGCDLRLVIDATGVLEGDGCIAEKSWRQIDAAAMARAFAVNAIGPALLIKNFLPLLPREGKSVFATLSARVGSISDNRLGGWYSYRASKAALNQIVRTAAIELQRTRPAAFCVAIHPGTVDTRLSSPFAKSGLEIQTPATAAQRLIKVLDTLDAGSTGGFIDQHGRSIGW